MSWTAAGVYFVIGVLYFASTENWVVLRQRAISNGRNKYLVDLFMMIFWVLFLFDDMAGRPSQSI